MRSRGSRSPGSSPYFRIATGDRVTVRPTGPGSPGAVAGTAVRKGLTGWLLDVEDGEGRPVVATPTNTLGVEPRGSAGG